MRKYSAMGLVFAMACSAFLLGGCSNDTVNGQAASTTAGETYGTVQNQSIADITYDWPVSEPDLERDAVYFLNCEDLPEESSSWTTPAGDRIALQSSGQWGMVDVGMTYTDAMEEQAEEGMERLLAFNGGSIELDFVVITHAHIDHYGYFADMFQNHPGLTMSDDFKVYFKYVDDADGDSEQLSRINSVYQMILSVLEERFGEEAPDHILQSDYESITLGDFSLDFYNCDTEAALQQNLNNSSTVVHLRHSNGADMLMMGDVEKDREAVLLSGELADISDVDILKAGHHGLPNSTSTAFFDQMNPSDVVVTGIDGMYNPSDDGTLAYKCLEHGANLYGTYFNPDGISLVFGEGSHEYTFYGDLTEEVPIETVPMSTGTIELKEYYTFVIDDTLKKVG